MPVKRLTRIGGDFAGWHGPQSVHYSIGHSFFTYDLARRLEGTRVTATVLHPGLTNTSFSAEDPSRLMAPLVRVLRPMVGRTST